jgi:hypothetical protein
MSAAKTGEAECRLIENAFLHMMQKPIFRQLDTRSDFPGPIEMIFTQDANYVRVGGAWKRTPGSGATRLAQFKRALSDQPLHDCSFVGEEMLDGVKTSLYRYAQGISPSVSVKIWIGSADRLPHQLQADVTLSKIDYDGVSAPPIGN